MVFLNESQRLRCESAKKSYSKRLSEAKNSLGQSLTESQINRLALVLSNASQYTNQHNPTDAKNESMTTSLADTAIQPIKTLDIITAVYPTLITDQIAKVIPVFSSNSLIPMLSTTYGQDWGDITAGDYMNSVFAGPSGKKGYSSGQVHNQEVANAGVTAVSATIGYDNPIFRGSLLLNDGAKKYRDNGQGHVFLLDSATGQPTGASLGTIDYALGTLTLPLITTTASTLLAQYQIDVSFSPLSMGSVKVEADMQTLTAYPKQLKVYLSIANQIGVDKSLGFSIQNYMDEMNAQELLRDQENVVIYDMYRQAGLSSTISAVPTQGFPAVQWPQEFSRQLVNDATQIQFATGRRVRGNFAVVGQQGANLLLALGSSIITNGIQFVPATAAEAKANSAFLGTLANSIRVFINVHLDTWGFKDAPVGTGKYLVGHHSDDLQNAGYVVGDFIPLYKTPVTELANMVQQRGYMTIYGKTMLNNKMFVKGLIVPPENP